MDATSRQCNPPPEPDFRGILAFFCRLGPGEQKELFAELTALETNDDHRIGLNRLVWKLEGVLSDRGVRAQGCSNASCLRPVFDDPYGTGLCEGCRIGRDHLDAAIDCLGFSARTYQRLICGGAYTPRILLGMTERDLMSISGFGKGTLEEVREKLRGFGIRLKAAPDPRPDFARRQTIFRPEELVSERVRLEVLG